MYRIAQRAGFGIGAWFLLLGSALSGCASYGSDPPAAAGSSVGQLRSAITPQMPTRCTAAYPDLLAQAGGYNSAGAAGIHVRRTKNCRVRAIYGKDFAIPLSTMGCAQGDTEAQARCFLDRYGEYFGVTAQAQQLVIDKTRDMDTGSEVVTFRQHAVGYPVFGARISLIIASAAVTSVMSAFREPIGSPPAADIQQQLDQLDLVAVATTAASYLGEPAVELGALEDVLFVDPADAGGLAVPAVSVPVFRADGERQLAHLVLSAVGPSVLHYANTENNLFPRARVYGSAEHATVEAIPCDITEPPALACVQSDLLCSPDYTFFGIPNLGLCVGNCFLPGHNCREGWHCAYELNNGTYYCLDYVGDGDGSEDDFVEVYDTDLPGGWTNVSGLLTHQFHKSYRNARTTLLDLMDWHTDALGIQEADLPPGFSYRVNLLTACDCTVEPPESQCTFDEGCSNAAQCFKGGVNGICLPGWYYDYMDRSPSKRRATYRTQAHEFGHVTFHEFYNHQSPPASTGLRESGAEMFAALFTEYSFPGEFGWGDETTGLSRQGHPLPYALRSRFDWFDTDGANDDEYWLGPVEPANNCLGANFRRCGPYYECFLHDPDGDGPKEHGYWCDTDNSAYCNWSTWMRFLRLLTKGPRDFRQYDEFIFADNTGAGIGIDAAQTIVYQALRLFGSYLGDSPTLRDWADCLLSIAEDNGHYESVRDTLGAVGFFTVDQQAGPQATDRSPREIIYAEWSASNHKRFLFWRDPSGDLPGGHRVRYRYSPGGGNMITATIPGSETTDRPAVVAHGVGGARLLYVFWRTPDGGIKYYVITPFGFNMGPFSLEDLGLRTNGAFEAAVYSGRLYLVFGDSATDHLSVAYCDNPLVCLTPSAWHEFQPGVYQHELVRQQVNPGPSAIAAGYVNNGPSGSRLYIAFSRRADGRIGVLPLDRDLTLGQNTIMPDDFPDYATTTTDQPLGLTVRRSAFPVVFAVSIPGFPPLKIYIPRSYLYLTFVSEERIYTSVIQSWADWVTIPVDTFRRARQDTGVSWRIDPRMVWRDRLVLSYTGDSRVQGSLPQRTISFGSY